MNEGKKILDACCGGRMFWFDRTNPNTLFVDKRIMINEKIYKERTHSVEPDMVMDFTSLDFPDNSFKMVVFDPPHMFLGENSWMAKKYGRLNRENWQSEIRKGFQECFRVLEEGGTLVFKWNEHNIPLKNILSLCEYKPLIGHPSGKAMKTHWVIFMKLENQRKDEVDFIFD